MASQLKALAQLIVQEVDALDSAYASQGKTFPSFDDPDAPPAIQDPAIIKHSELALAAASRLAAELKRPDMSIMQAAMGMFDTAALGVVVEANIVEILRDAGPQGLHISEIGARAGLDVNKLARCLRHITTTRHIFKEGPPDVFSNNRLSGSMDTKKPLDQLKARGLNRYTNAKGIAPLIGHTADEVFRGAAEIPDLVTNPATSGDENPAHAPMLIGNHSPSGSMFEFFEEEKNDWRFSRFHAAMAGLDLPKDHVVTAYDWGSLKAGSLVVDVGGGAGGPLNVLAQAHKHLRYVLQDRPVVIAAAEKHLKNVYPGAIEDGLITLQEHDFFTTQPLKNVSVFMLRFITHNWPNAHASKILASLRPVATPDTRVVLIEHIVKHACPTKGLYKDIPGAEEEDIPEVLQGNMGAAEVTAGYDLQMYTILNAQERTVGQFGELAASAGWKLHSIVRGHSHADNLIILAPA